MNQQRVNQNNPQHVEQRIRTLRILWIAMFMSIVFYYALTFFIAPSEGVEPNTTLFLVLLGVAVSTTLVSFFVKNSIINRAVEQQNLQLVQQGYIVALALTEVPALLGLVTHISTGDRNFYVLFLISVFGQLLHFPRREHVINASAMRPIS